MGQAHFSTSHADLTACSHVLTSSFLTLFWRPFCHSHSWISATHQTMLFIQRNDAEWCLVPCCELLMFMKFTNIHRMFIIYIFQRLDRGRQPVDDPDKQTPKADWQAGKEGVCFFSPACSLIFSKVIFKPPMFSMSQSQPFQSIMTGASTLPKWANTH